MSEAKTIYLKDYRKPDYLVKDIHLTFKLNDTQTQVKSVMRIERNAGISSSAKLVLNGEQMKLLSVKLEDKVLTANEYNLTDEVLEIFAVPERFTLEIENEINPEANKALEGLYKSGNIFCTQNEPEGFRRITYYIDRPDVMAKFTTKVIGDKLRFPVLLSNGNPIARGDLEGGQHYVEWQDPFPKPSYLYSLVAGDLGVIKDTYKTVSGRKIDLEIYCDKGNEDKCHHAMLSLKNSMRWDEETYGLEYDLDIYMIVAVDSFNMGAMENKGLNIFNSAYVLAKPETATDANFLGIEGVIGHEYFHNWTGNRITCQNWFQLTLKEGLTVFRDQNFSADMNSKLVKRIEDVMRLKAAQLPEDAGPNAHPIKPNQYMEINNFYTATVYEKGSEVIRMIETFLGKQGFRKGMDKYFELFDGQAVRTEDFLHAMSVANNHFDFSQFENWYHQAGTPELKIQGRFDSAAKTYTLTVEQSCRPTPGQEVKKPYHLPLALGLVDKNGKDMTLSLKDSSHQPQVKDGILHIRKEKEEFVFTGIEVNPVLSVNRNFSAPVNVRMEQSLDDRIFLLAHDSDGFNRYEAGQIIATNMILSLMKDYRAGKTLSLDSKYVEAYGKLLADETLDPSFKAYCLALPPEMVLHGEQTTLDVEATHVARKFVRKTLAQAHKVKLQDIYQKMNKGGEYKVDSLSMGQRALKNTALGMLMSLGDQETFDLCERQYNSATNMTDESAALTFMADSDHPKRQESLQKFYNKWKHEPLVMQKWLSFQASSSRKDTLEVVRKLEKDPVFDKTVPNFVRSLIAAFARNAIHFHAEDGSGYAFVGQWIYELDSFNPQIAAGLAKIWSDYKRLPEKHQVHMKRELEKIKAKSGLSKGTFEIVSKTLA